MAVTKDLGAVTAYGYARDGGYTGTEEQFTTEQGNIANTAAAALASARDSEAYAKGTRGGSAVPSTDPAYENHSKYYAQVSHDYAVSAAANTAEAYDPTLTYNVGDYVTYNTALYKCITAITTAEAWTSAHWESVLVGNELSDVKSDLDDLKSHDFVFVGADGNLYYHEEE